MCTADCFKPSDKRVILLREKTAARTFQTAVYLNIQTV